jgi:hypothetical protein
LELGCLEVAQAKEDEAAFDGDDVTLKCGGQVGVWAIDVFGEPVVFFGCEASAHKGSSAVEEIIRVSLGVNRVSPMRDGKRPRQGGAQSGTARRTSGCRRETERQWRSATDGGRAMDRCARVSAGVDFCAKM